MFSGTFGAVKGRTLAPSDASDGGAGLIGLISAAR